MGRTLPRAFRVLGNVLFLLALLVAALALYLRYGFPQEEFRALLVQRLSERLDREVRIRAIRVNPLSGIVCRGIAVAPGKRFSPGTQNLLECERLLLRYDPLELLHGKLVITTFLAERASVWIDPSSPPRLPVGPSGKTPGTPLHLRIDTIELPDATFHFLPGGRTLGASITLYDPGTPSMQIDAEVRDPRFPGRVYLTGTPESLFLSSDGLSLGEGGPVRSLSGQLRAKRQEDGGFLFSDVAVDLVLASGKSVPVRGRLRIPRGGELLVVESASFPSLGGRVDLSGRVPVRGLKERRKVSELRGLSLSFHASEIRLGAVVSNATGTIRADGAYAVDRDGEPLLSATASWRGLSAPLPGGTLRLSDGAFRITDNRLESDVYGITVGREHVRATISSRNVAARRFTANLATESLSLRSLLSNFRGGNGVRRRMPEGMLVEGNLSANRLRVGWAELEGVTGRFQAERDRLFWYDLAARAYKGSLAGKVVVELSDTPLVLLDLRGADLRAQRALPAAGAKGDRIFGDLSFALSGNFPPGGFLEAFRGDLSLSLVNGEIRNTGLQERLNFLVSGAFFERVPFDEARAAFAANAGVLTTEDLAFRGPDVVGSYRGAVTTKLALSGSLTIAISESMKNRSVSLLPRMTNLLLRRESDGFYELPLFRVAGALGKPKVEMESRRPRGGIE